MAAMWSYNKRKGEEETEPPNNWKIVSHIVRKSTASSGCLLIDQLELWQSTSDCCLLFKKVWKPLAYNVLLSEYSFCPSHMVWCVHCPGLQRPLIFLCLSFLLCQLYNRGILKKTKLNHSCQNTFRSWMWSSQVKHYWEINQGRVVLKGTLLGKSIRSFCSRGRVPANALYHCSFCRRRRRLWEMIWLF